MTRTDLHRPSAIIPADYDFVCHEVVKIEGATAGFGRINRREGASCLWSGTVDAAAIDLTVRN